MAIDSKHPLYSDFFPDWKMMRDFYKGSRQVKDMGVEYLPPTGGQIIDGMLVGQLGHKNYEAYKERAVFPEYVKEAIEAFVGLLFQKDPVIELPAAMEPMRENATRTGESLIALLRKIAEEQLLTGRVGILADLPVVSTPDAVPYIVTYSAESVINWDDAQFEAGRNSLNLVVLNESGYVRAPDFQWEESKQYRVLQLGNLDANEADGTVTYTQGVFVDQDYNPKQMKPPTYRGAPLKQIPFVFVNSKDIVAEPDIPPLLGLANAVLGIYRGEADYRQNLHMQGQDTLVVVGTLLNADGEPGEDDAIRTGSGSRLNVDIGGDAKYIGVGSNGLGEQREALSSDRTEAETKAGKLISNQNNEESGVALHTRLAAQTATLNQLANTSAEGLQNLLRVVAEWMGSDPKEVVVKPNLEFSDFELNGREFVDLMTARTMGAPLSLESIHSVMVDRGLTELDYETEIEKIAAENATLGSALPGNRDSSDDE